MGLHREILDEAASWVGTPYHHKGRVKGVGVDCGGYIHCVYGRFFSLKPFPDYYAEDWALHRGQELYLDFIGEYVREVPRPVPAGLALFQFGRCFAHGAICTEDRRFLHAWGRTQCGSVQKSARGFFRYPDGRLRAVKFFEVVPC